MFRREMPEIKSGDVIKYCEDEANYLPSYLLVVVSDVRGMMGYPIYEVNGAVQIGIKWLDIDPESVIEIHSCGNEPWHPEDLRAIVRGEIDGHGEWEDVFIVSQTEINEQFGGRIRIVDDELYNKLYKKLKEANK